MISSSKAVNSMKALKSPTVCMLFYLLCFFFYNFEIFSHTLYSRNAIMFTLKWKNSIVFGKNMVFIYLLYRSELID